MSKDKKDISEYLKRNTKLTVKTATDSSLYDSRIEDITDKMLYISQPTLKGKPAHLYKGSSLTVSIIAGQGRISFDSKVVSVVETPFRMIVVEKPNSYRNEQLRQFYRIPVDLPIEIYHDNLERFQQYSKFNKIPSDEGRLLELSGGGAQIFTRLEIETGDSLVLDFEGTIIGLGYIEAKVVRKHEKVGERKFFSITFPDINELKRDVIIKYVFRRQMELRKLT